MIRQKFIELVVNKDIRIKDAAATLGIMYGTAKSIVAVYKIQNRTSKIKKPERSHIKTLDWLEVLLKDT